MTFLLLLVPLLETFFSQSHGVLIKDVDWCNMAECKEKKFHTICKWGIYCTPYKNCETSIGFSKELKDYVMEMHNKKRNKIALGEEDKVPDKLRTAADMNSLQWHIHLEYVARCHSRQCEFKHDECRVIPEFSHVGQNIYTKSYNNKNPKDINIKSVVEQGVEAWYEEIENAPEEIYKTWHKTEKGSGHYTQMVWAQTTHIGCGLSQSKDGEKLQFFLVCNYGTQGNVDGELMYTVGEPCSKCPKGKECNPELKGLCGNVEEFALRCPCEGGAHSEDKETTNEE